MRTIIMAALTAAALFGQQLDLSSLDKFAAKAKESANVSLDADKLSLASQFLRNNKEQEQKAKDLIKQLKGVFVRTFEFDREGQFTSADLDPIRQQLQRPGWSRIVEVKDQKETAAVYFFTENNQVAGIAVIATEPTEVAVVNIVGPIDMSTLGGLAGSLGIPAGVFGNSGPAQARKPQQ